MVYTLHHPFMVIRELFYYCYYSKFPKDFWVAFSSVIQHPPNPNISRATLPRLRQQSREGEQDRRLSMSSVTVYNFITGWWDAYPFEEYESTLG